jgi:hypothetical protein
LCLNKEKKINDSEDHRLACLWRREQEQGFITWKERGSISDLNQTVQELGINKVNCNGLVTTVHGGKPWHSP